MLTAILVCFIVGYLAIALEHPLMIDKAASALLLAVVCWTIYALNVGTITPASEVPGWFSQFKAEAHGGPASESTPGSVEVTGESSDPATDGTAAGTRDAGLDHDAAAHADGDHDGDHDGTQGDGHTGSHELSGVELSREYMVEHQLRHLLGEVAEILFFLLGAMTIVEVVDANEGFCVITDRIDSGNRVKLMWVTSWLAFFMSAVLDNLTSTIVMVSLLKKIIKDDSRKLYVGMVVVAANAGGAWTVIGDVTTTMLWIAGKISVFQVMLHVVLPSVVCLLLPLLVLSYTMDKHPPADAKPMPGGTGPGPVGHGMPGNPNKNLKPWHQYFFLALGLTLLLSVPVFKIVTHLPPYLGMSGALGLLWIISDIVRRRLDDDTRTSTNVTNILRHVDTASLLFFLGILMAVGCLQSTGQLREFAEWTAENVESKSTIAVLTGLGSAVIDNVPLVAAGIKMFDDPADDPFWQLLAYCAGCGGSCLIIGSAAGVAAMGLDHISFGWYLKKIGPLALLGYFGGVLTFLLQMQVFALFG